jgi:hypothetical protein
MCFHQSFCMCAPFVTRHTTMRWSSTRHTRSCISGVMVSTTRLSLIQQDGDSPRVYRNVRGLLDPALPQRWVGRAAGEDLPFSVGHPGPWTELHVIHSCGGTWRAMFMYTMAPIALGSPEQNQSYSGDHHTWNVAADVAKIRPAHSCAPGNEKCTHSATLMDAHNVWTVKFSIDTCYDCTL